MGSGRAVKTCSPQDVCSPLSSPRLLDDNRELFVPELNEVVRPHPHFMLFATQVRSGGVLGDSQLCGQDAWEEESCMAATQRSPCVMPFMALNIAACSSQLQNPPGAYAGRKALSRAFRGRFLELHVEELPDGELAEILEKR